MRSTTLSLLVLVIILAGQNEPVQSFTLFEQPKMMLVSFDGFRWDYLKMYDLPNFEYLKSMGSHAEYIKNSFATVTFPNHWTIVTGMYEESHGIVQNSMHDRDLKKEFEHISNDSQTVEWYGQNPLTEPIWISNQKAGGGRKSAAEWVGAGVSFDDQAAIFIPYNNTKPYVNLIDEFVGMYVRGVEPINFGAIYFDEPDHTGHLHGPYSPEMEAKLYSIDTTLGYLIEKLKSNDLFSKMNLIITSDHGMEEITEKTAIFLDSYIDTELFEAFGSRACFSLFVKNETDTEYIYKTLNTVKNIDIFRKHEIPDHLHYKNNVRIGDLVIITKIGYGVYINNQKVNWTINRGDHGYNNKNSAMHPIFIAHGPGFKQNFTIEPFKNVDIYPLMCLLLDINPGTGHNGTLANVIDMVIQNKNDKVWFLAIAIIVPLIFIFGIIHLCCIRAEKISSEVGYQDVDTGDSSEEAITDVVVGQETRG